MKVVNKEHQSILDLKLPFRNYDARIAFVCFEVPCCFEVHIPVLHLQVTLSKSRSETITIPLICSLKARPNEQALFGKHIKFCQDNILGLLVKHNVLST